MSSIPDASMSTLTKAIDDLEAELREVASTGGTPYQQGTATRTPAASLEQSVAQVWLMFEQFDPRLSERVAGYQTRTDDTSSTGRSSHRG